MLKNKTKFKKILFCLITVSSMPIFLSSCSSTFDKKVQTQQDLLIKNVRNINSQLSQKWDEFSNFISNKNKSTPSQNIEFYYLKIAQQAQEVAKKFNDLSKFLSTQKYGSEFVFVNNWKNLITDNKDENSLFQIMDKFNYINSDLMKLVKDKEDLKDSYYKSLIDEIKLFLDIEDGRYFINNKEQIIKMILEIKNFEQPNSQTLDQYSKNWFNKRIENVNYDLIKAFVENSSDFEQKATFHSHAIGNIFREWVYVVVEKQNPDSSVNGLDNLEKFINDVEANKDQNNLFIYQADLKQNFDNLKEAVQQLKAAILEISKGFNGHFPISKILEFFIDQNDQNQYTSGYFGVLNSLLFDLYNQLKK
ncbi:hypothetical protein V2E24_00140 [Mycoplasmopsis ciconiae]|uniref:Lipoprotein n=1 Tax=Mycoplasmopsis ciconiae TaxID=561067 RepID=A0ABU7MLC4_9BACT|nr:hypothetical protein [Mycoplasmopsis ciconiae]